MMRTTMHVTMTAPLRMLGEKNGVVLLLVNNAADAAPDVVGSGDADVTKRD